MSGRTLSRKLAIVASLMFALPLWAKPLKKSIELYSPAQVGNTMLPAGRYELIIGEKTATFEQANKIVAETPYRWKRVTKSPADAMLFDKDELSGIEFAGKSTAIEFTKENASVSPSPRSLGNR